MSLRELSKRASKIDIRKLALKIAKSNSGLITDNVIDQLEVGIAGDNKIVGTYKTAYYAGIKKREGSNAPFGVVNLKLSTSLYKGLDTKIKGNEVITDSKVEYSKYQIDRYGKRIYENTPKNKEKVRDENSRDTVGAYKSLLGV